MKKRKKMITIKSLDKLPRRFKSEDAERRFWETHDLSLKLCEELYDPVVNEQEKKLMKHLKLTDRRK